MTRAQGVDVSVYQSMTPNTDALDFLFARASIGTSQDGRYKQHTDNARNAGLVVGAYHFAYGDIQIAAQVAVFLAAAKNADLYAVDIEGDRAPTHAQTADFIARVQATGRRIGLYHSDSGYFDAGQDWNWVANWSQTPSHKWDFHQYRGAPLDLDRFRGTAAELRLFAIPVPPTDPDPGDDPMDIYAVPKVPTQAYIAKGKVLYPTSDLRANDPGRVIIEPGRQMPYLGNPLPGVSIVERVTETGAHTGQAWYVHSADIGAQTPITGDCTAAIAADRQKAHIVYG